MPRLYNTRKTATVAAPRVNTGASTSLVAGLLHNAAAATANVIMPPAAAEAPQPQAAAYNATPVYYAAPPPNVDVSARLAALENSMRVQPSGICGHMGHVLVKMFVAVIFILGVIAAMQYGTKETCLLAMDGLKRAQEMSNTGDIAMYAKTVGEACPLMHNYKTSVFGLISSGMQKLDFGVIMHTVLATLFGFVTNPASLM